MLVLSRKVGEQIVVPESGIVLTVLSIRGGQIRLGISAPPEVAVYREELWRSKVAAQFELRRESTD
jgi:carbon storage regulator